MLQKIVVTGNTAISDAEIAEITRPLEGTTVDFQKLQAVADGITQLYLDRGYLTSRAIIPEQTAANGVVTIQVIEGGLERIEVQGNQRVSTEYIRSRVALGGITPLRQDRLEDQLRLLRSDPLFENVEASLRAGEGVGKSILVVRVTEANPFLANFSADNYSPPSVGSEKLGLGFGLRNVTGAGDQFLASYSFSTTSGSSLWDLSYRYPLNPMNGTIQLRFAPSSYRITDPTFAAFGIRGTTDLYDITFRQPLVRSPREEFALSFGFTYQRGQTFLFNNIPQQFGIGPDADGVSTTSVLKFGQDYVSRDIQGAWALRSQFNFGLGIFGATSNPEPVPDGSFFSWLLQAQRVQLLSPDQLLIIQADLQLAANTLLPSQQFVIGGGQSVRGFRQNVRSGDNGFRFSIENRITVQRDESGAPLVRLAPFLDIGAVWNVDGNPNLLPSQTFLAAAGIGFLWEPLPRLNIRLDYAVPFINLNDRGINVQ
ncbi:MAG: ShlB/FhaC/HecB family hemolysin secretion/activation protein, partial [Cyanobacteria bacterium]|nr:ShlB/FhaC/HecB family hemolysin secretion/activation protein [Cyanobacteriota bacterium]MDW8200586.1 ShlB/FhaC/HecB family hemolysin secretion/activation protein [Cyanobacteriota bacterium SKYGB_h_bin112]